MERRRALKLLGGGLTAIASGKAVDNVLLGYGAVVGTNLHEQDVGAFVAEALLDGTRTTDVGRNQLQLWDDVLRVRHDGEPRTTRRYTELSPEEARALDERYGLDGLVADARPTLQALHAGEYEVVPASYGPFFERVRRADPAPASVELLRSDERTDPATVRAFAGADPTDPEAVVEGLVAGFREHTSYDVPRYTAGSIQHNVIFGAVDVKQHLEDEVDFDSLLENENSGMFCNEFADRAVEALHAAPARDQSAPVFVGRVRDVRHRHVYTAIASIVREDGDLVVPVTFVDYTHSTLYDDFHVRGLLGTGLDAYNTRHRMTGLWW
jgi:hypothetical protein